MKSKVIITKEFPAEIVEPLQSMAQVVQWQDAGFDLMPRERVLSEILDASAIINQAELRVDKELLEHGKELKIIANVSIGYDNLDIDLMTHASVWASNVPGYFNDPVAEYVIGAVLAWHRRLIQAHDFVRDNNWSSFQPGRWDGQQVRGKTFGILGMGDIGRLVGHLASAVGMQVIYHNRSPVKVPFKSVSLDELLGTSDILSLHVPHTESTHHMISDREFLKMKPGVLFVNTSRGKVVDQSSLIKALGAGKIGGAILDVFEYEPAVPDQIRMHPNVYLSPHIAGGTREARVKSYRLAVENVMDVLRGDAPRNALNELK